jgi:hypothetical protein
VAAWVRRTHHGGEPRERPAAAARGEEGGAREEGPRVGYLTSSFTVTMVMPCVTTGPNIYNTVHVAFNK